jgi:hypothetical protein
MKVSEAIELLTTTYQSLDSVALGLPVDAKEVNDALAKTDKNSAEYVALTVLAKFNPYEKITKEKAKQYDDTNQDE